MRDKAATAAGYVAPIKRVLLALCISTCAGSALAQLSDPMAPPGMGPGLGAESGVRTGAASELQGIISGPGRRLALINGSVVQVGETIPGDGELLNVGRDSATVRSNNKSHRLRLHPDVVKKEPPQ